VEFATLYDGVIEPLGLQRSGMLFINDEYGRSMGDIFRRRAGPAAALNEAYGFDVSDFRPLVARVRLTGLDALIVVGYGSQAGSLIRQLREGGFEGRILVPSLIVNTDSVTQAAGGSLRGVIFNGYTYDMASPITQSLLERFRARYKGRQSDIGVLAYVGAKIVLQHRVSEATPAQTIAALQAAQPFDTILGKVGFSGRSFTYPLKLYEVGPNGIVPFSPRP
jgi:branched-chain amino acid transport system substrate-binding protein